jgi:hypothetical protein
LIEGGFKMDIKDGIAHITTKDGRKFQVLNEAGDDWDEAETARLAQEHEVAMAQAEAENER